MGKDSLWDLYLYKENSEKYKRKLQNRTFEVFTPKPHSAVYLRWLAALLGSYCFFWHPH